MGLRNPIRALVPSMFHRRLLLLAMAVGLVWLALLARLAELITVEASAWRERAEVRLVQHAYLPTVRGRVLDRRHRVLAEDRPAYDLAVDYEVISGRWAYRRARRAAFRTYRDTWNQYGEPQREAWIAEQLPRYAGQVDEMWQALAQWGGVDLLELERRRAAVVEKVQAMKTHLWLSWYQRRVDDAAGPLLLADVAGRIGEELQAHTLLSAVDAEVRMAALRRTVEAEDDADSVWKSLRIVDASQRVYPFEQVTVRVDRTTLPSPVRHRTPKDITVDGVGIHVIGGMRKLWAEDTYLDNRPFIARTADGQTRADLKGYQPGDEVGGWGVEQSCEELLRGSRGELRRHRESQQTWRTEPVGGQDVVLSIDILLQARLQALMGQTAETGVGLMQTQEWHEQTVSEERIGKPLNGAAVVLDIATSQVLAAASVPGFSRADLQNRPAEYWESPEVWVQRPKMFRPVAMPYQPGSTLKPLTFVAAFEEHRVTLDEAIDCQGALDMDHPGQNRCWIFKHGLVGHGPLTATEALRRSCNIYFYTMGRRLGAVRLVRWLERLGLGQVTDCGLTPEHAGRLPDLRHADNPNAPGFGLHDAIQMGIGQGPVEWTPIQAASAYAALARGGFLVAPTFLIAPTAGERPRRDLKLDPRGVDCVMQGLLEAVVERTGTSHSLVKLDHEPIFNIPGVVIRGKSGTADPGNRWIDYNRDRKVTRDEIIRRDHAWFVGLIQREGSPRPDFVVVVVVEYAGSGGAVSGPIVNQILYAMRAEGYL